MAINYHETSINQLNQKKIILQKERELQTTNTIFSQRQQQGKLSMHNNGVFIYLTIRIIMTIKRVRVNQFAIPEDISRSWNGNERRGRGPCGPPGPGGPVGPLMD